MFKVLFFSYLILINNFILVPKDDNIEANSTPDKGKRKEKKIFEKMPPALDEAGIKTIFSANLYLIFLFSNRRLRYYMISGSTTNLPSS